MEEWNSYIKTAETEMRPWFEGDDMTGVSISQVDIDGGSPKLGDMIARNPAKPDDRWLVARDYFEANYSRVYRSVQSDASRRD